MRAKIDENGYLHVLRAGKMKKQACMFGAPYVEGDVYCGDWCPAFREPDRTPLPEPEMRDYFELQLCQQVGTLFFDEIEDQRRA